MMEVTHTNNQIETFLNRFENVSETGDQFLVRCPCHNDETGSLAIRFTEDGKILLHCHAGCDTKDIVSRVGLTVKDLFREKNVNTYPSPRKPLHTCTPGLNLLETEQKRCAEPFAHPLHTPLTDCTPPAIDLQSYANFKRLPENFLKSLFIGNVHHKKLGQNVVRLPYLDPSGMERATRYRIALEGTSKFIWKTGARPFLYGLWLLGNGRPPESVVLCEGESDAQTLWYHGYNAIGLPGAKSWNEKRDAGVFERIKTIYLIDEEDDGTEAIMKWVSLSAIRDKVRFVRLNPYKDPSALYIDDPERFKDRFDVALKEAVSWGDMEAQRAQERFEASVAACDSLSGEKNILDVFAKRLPAVGFAGDASAAKLLYLALTTRIFKRPTSIKVDGPSSAGKSFLVDSVLLFFPPEAVHEFSGMSEKLLAYTDKVLSYKFIVLYEASGMATDFQTYLIRSLLSEGRIKYSFVESTNEGLKARDVEKEGPTGLIVTTTATLLHPENETRVFTVSVKDTEEQTKLVLDSLAKENLENFNFEEWRALQTLIGQQDPRITIPFATKISKHTKPVSVRLRRDFSALLSLIKAHAIVHFRSRERNDRGFLVATLEDYGAALSLVNPLVSSCVEASVPDSIRATVSLVGELAKKGEEVTVRAVSKELKIDRSAAQRRIKSAVDRGLLKDLDSEKSGMSHRYALDNALSEDTLIFPSVKTIRQALEEEQGCAADEEGVQSPCTPPCTPEKCLNSDTSVGGVQVCTTFQGGRGVVRNFPDFSRYQRLFVDIETRGVDPYRDAVVLFQVNTGEEIFIVEVKQTDLGPVKGVLEDPNVLKVIHNAIFETKMLKRHFGIEMRNVFDTLLAERLLTVGTGSLRDTSLVKVVKKYAGVTLDKTMRTSFDQGWEVSPEQIEYAKKDVEFLPQIFEAQKKRLEAEGLLPTAELEFSLVRAMAEIELRGMGLDKTKLEDLKKSLRGRIMDLETRLREFAPVNFSSPKQVKQALHDLGFKVKDTSDKTLEGIDHPFTKLMLEHREVSKLFTSFANKFEAHVNPATGRIHADFFQLGTSTGRISCQRPNLQQIPKDQAWRDLFSAPEGYKMITADYSQIELRILAEFSKDKKFIEAFQAGEDFHQKTADLVGISRNAAKGINFGLMYGMWAGGLAKRLSVPVEEAEKFISVYFSTFPGVKKWLEEAETKPLTLGYTLTPLGRKRFFKPVETMKEHGEARRQGRNTPIQSTCGDILKKALLLVSDELRGFEAGVVNLVHDELVIEAKDDLVDGVAKAVEDCMVQAGEEFIKSVPVVVDVNIDQRWKK